MRRRGLLVGGGLLAFGAVGYAASSTDTISGALSDSTGTVIEPGTFEYLTHGVDTAAWTVAGEHEGRYENQVTLEIAYQDSAPDALRLHDSNGKKRWSESEPSGDAGRFVMGTPLTPTGTWNLVATQAGEQTSLQLPVAPSLVADRFELVGDRLQITIRNDSNTPAWLKDLQLTAVDRYIERWRVMKRLMPGESFQYAADYPFDHYEDVQLNAIATGGRSWTVATVDFV